MTEIEDVTFDEREEFESRLAKARRREIETETETKDGKRVAWSPQPGSQVDFLQCPLAELLIHGTRGGGKTDALLMSFAKFVGRGHGQAWRVVAAG